MVPVAWLAADGRYIVHTDHGYIYCRGQQIWQGPEPSPELLADAQVRAYVVPDGTPCPVRVELGQDGVWVAQPATPDAWELGMAANVPRGKGNTPGQAFAAYRAAASLSL